MKREKYYKAGKVIIWIYCFRVVIVIDLLKNNQEKTYIWVAIGFASFDS